MANTVQRISGAATYLEGTRQRQYFSLLTPSLTPVSQVEEDSSFIFIVLLAIAITCALALWLKIKCQENQQDPESDANTINEQQLTAHKQLLWIYIPAFLLAASADWTQGPYKYAVYMDYEYSEEDISYFFITGFMSA